MMGSAFLSLFLANITLGWLGRYYEHWSPTTFWAMNVIIPAAGGVLALLLKPLLDRVLNDEATEEETREAVSEFSR